MSRARKKQIGLAPHRGVVLALIVGMPFMPARAQSDDQKIQDLEQKVEELDQRVKVTERNNELKDEDAAAQAKNAASVTADTGGFTIRSNDGNFLLKIGADLQVDNRAFVGDGAAAGADTILLRRVRLSPERFTSMSITSSGPISARGRPSSMTRIWS
jgi:phosphate-selective porin OprO/OprP